MDQQKTGALLKVLRREKNLTQEQLAEQFGVSSRTVSRWENGNSMPDISLLMEISDFYDVDIREILDGERKSGKMDEKMKDTIVKVTDYARANKAGLLWRVRIISCVGLAALLIGLILEFVDPMTGIPVYEYFKGVSFGLAVGALVTMVLYTTGMLAKIRDQKIKKCNMKVLAVICFVIVGVCLIASIIASFS